MSFLHKAINIFVLLTKVTNSSFIKGVSPCDRISPECYWFLSVTVMMRGVNLFIHDHWFLLTLWCLVVLNLYKKMLLAFLSFLNFEMAPVSEMDRHHCCSPSFIPRRIKGTLDSSSWKYIHYLRMPPISIYIPQVAHILMKSNQSATCPRKCEAYPSQQILTLELPWGAIITRSIFTQISTKDTP